LSSHMRRLWGSLKKGRRIKKTHERGPRGVPGNGEGKLGGEGKRSKNHKKRLSSQKRVESRQVLKATWARTILDRLGDEGGGKDIQNLSGPRN